MVPFRSLRTLLLTVIAAGGLFCYLTANAPAAPEPASAASQPASGNATATSTTSEASTDDSKPTRQAIEEQIRKVQQNEKSLDESTKSELLKRYQAAIGWITEQEETQKKTAQYQAEITGAPELMSKVKSQLDVFSSEPALGFPPETSLQEMEQKLQEAKTELKTAETVLAQRQEERDHRVERKAELAKLIDEKRQQLEAADKQLVTLKGNGESAELVAARRMEFAAHRATLEQQLKYYQAELQRYDAVADLLPLQRKLALWKKNYLGKKVEAIQTAVAAKRKEDSAQQVRQARQTSSEIDNSVPVLRTLAGDNVTLADKQKALMESLPQVSKKVRDANKTLSDLETEFKKIKERVRYAGNSSGIGAELRSMRESLPDTGKSEQQIRSVTQEMLEKNRERLGYQEQQNVLGDLDVAVREAIAELKLPPADAHEETYRKETRELLEKRWDLLDNLINGYYQYLTELSNLEIANNKLIAEVEDIEDYIDERVLWVRSAEMLGPGSFTKAAQEVIHFCKPGPWIELSKQCGWGAIRKPGVILLMVAVLGLLFALQRRMRNLLRNLCTAVSGSAKLKTLPTLEGLLLTVAMAAPLPLLLLLAGWWLRHTNGTGDLGQAVGLGLHYTAIPLWILTFTRRLCAPGLLGESHFDWSPYGLAIARQHLRWLAYLGMPLIFVVIVADRYHKGVAANSVGRLAFIGIMLLLAVFMHLVLFSKNNVLREFIARQPDSWVVRFRSVLYLLSIGLPLCFAIMAGVGYYYSAQQLALRLDATLGLLLGFVLLHAVVSRWFLVKRRNLAIDEMKERQSRDPESTPNVSTIIPVVEADQDWSQVHQRLQYLLYNAVAVGFLVGTWMIWANVLPALKILENREFTFWYSTVEVVKTHHDANGDLVREAIPTVVPTTVRHALIAIMILIATFVIGRHLPALLEITILNRMRLDRGGRHAISVLLRYLVALIGVFLACNTMSITWRSVQWLAAGMTVGLGFGLQEIFANFISGLILLFERPIRVGDIITLGDTTGTVTNIRIRATTVTNWDRKELIVPNKELITGQLLNWTLSDAVNRIVITVGIAYKSDTRKARDLILQIATEHPNVLKDPPPHVTFEAFGDSTLDFVLRCYITSMEHRLDTIHDLHEAINDRFNQESIEIAFPQRDLHLRSVEQAIPLAQQQKRDEVA